MKTNSGGPTPCLDPVARLALSRELLRQSLNERLQSHSRGHQSQGQWADLKSLPAAALLMETLRAWTQGQPLRMSAALLADTLKAALAPLANRHPLGLVFGSAALAGLLVWARPWRWGFVKPALLAGLAQQLLSKALSGATLETVLATLAKFSSSTASAAAAPSSDPSVPTRP